MELDQALENGMLEAGTRCTHKLLPLFQGVVVAVRTLLRALSPDGIILLEIVVMCPSAVLQH